MCPCTLVYTVHVDVVVGVHALEKKGELRAFAVDIQ